MFLYLFATISASMYSIFVSRLVQFSVLAHICTHIYTLFGRLNHTLHTNMTDQVRSDVQEKLVQSGEYEK